jgi:hypothetical protein
MSPVELSPESKPEEPKAQYSRINSTNSPGACNLSKPKMTSQVRTVSEFVCV